MYVVLLAPRASYCSPLTQCPPTSELAPPPPCRLSWNHLGDEMAAELAQVLPQMGQLKRVEYDYTLGWVGGWVGCAEGTLILNKPRGHCNIPASWKSAQCLGTLSQAGPKPLPSLVRPMLEPFRLSSVPTRGQSSLPHAGHMGKRWPCFARDGTWRRNTPTPTSSLTLASVFLSLGYCPLRSLEKNQITACGAQLLAQGLVHGSCVPVIR